MQISETQVLRGIPRSPYYSVIIDAVDAVKVKYWTLYIKSDLQVWAKFNRAKRVPLDTLCPYILVKTKVPS